jgi:protoporphyrinogen oxidase
MPHVVRFSTEEPVVVIGAGPAGLTAARELVRRGEPVVICEADRQVGGLARTIEYKGFRFDIGGHRFFTKSAVVSAIWRSVLGADLLHRGRMSRIFYRGRYFDYPLKPANVLFGLGLFSSARVLLSYLAARLKPIRPEVSFADWVINRFGRRLYRMFFATYTEKVWGISPESIRAQWAAQRIKGLSLGSAVRHMLLPFLGRRSDSRPKTLIEAFDYPRLGPGMMWEAMAKQVQEAGADLRTETAVVALHHDGTAIRTVEIEQNHQRSQIPVGQVISTMPIRDLIQALRPAPPPEVEAAARRLAYRDFVTVALILDVPDLFPDNWIYVHDDSVRVGRIQNFKNWSPDMVPDPAKTCLGLEYFCFEHDGLWSMPDEELIKLATRELSHLGLANPALVSDGAVVRARKAYPVYDEGYAEALEHVRQYLSTLGNLQLVGRNGMHKYNNQDHSMLTAILAVRNLAGERHDLWAINSDDTYHEEILSEVDGLPESAVDARRIRRTQPSVPQRIPVAREP